MSSLRKLSLAQAKKEAQRAAMELCYPAEIVKKIEVANSIEKINRIMIDARRYL